MKKTYGGVEVQLHLFLNSTLDGSGWSATRPCTQYIKYTHNEVFLSARMFHTGK